MQEEVRQEIINSIKEKNLVKPAEILLELLNKVKIKDKHDLSRNKQLQELAKEVLENEEFITTENVVTIPKMIEYLDNGTNLTREQVLTIADDLFTKDTIPYILNIMESFTNKDFVTFEIEKGLSYFGLRFISRTQSYNICIIKIVNKEEVMYQYPVLNFKHGLLTTFILSNLLHYLIINLGTINTVINNKYIEKLLDITQEIK